ncbi:HEAT repeat domain-containing protein [Actinoplanes sp. CA-252034]|uniref:HEAT repeat domain-containing protein n=1 Tax=Actinoplanes sp. CA-252034 TaxID=3239906 RepID=UPI003D958A49
MKALADDDPLCRAHAATALARLGDRAAAKPVRALRDDPDPRVRAAAGTASQRLRRRFGLR